MSARVVRAWHIEERHGYAYATNQFGGFSRYGTPAQALAAIKRDVAEFGDTLEGVAS